MLLSLCQTAHGIDSKEATFNTYSNDLRGEVALADHKIPSLVQFDDGSSVGLNLRLKGLMFLQLTLCREGKGGKY